MLRQHHRRTFSKLAVAAVSFVLNGACPAALRVHEPFNYSATEGPDLNEDGRPDLKGQNGGFGFSSAWDDTSGSSSGVPDYDYVQAGSLVFGSIQGSVPATGNSLRSYAPNGGFSNTKRDLTPISGTTGTEVWISYLVRKDAGRNPPSGDDVFGLQLFSSTGAEGVGFGDMFSSGTYGIDTTEGAGDSGIAIKPLGETVFLVLRIQFRSGADEFSLFVNPNPRATMPGGPNAMVTGPDLPNISRLVIEAQGESSVQWSLDEIRMGDSYVCVVPEPSSLLLAALGTSCLGARRFRKTS